MNHFRKLLASVAILIISLLITRCGSDEKLVLPPVPTVTTDASSLALERGEVTSFDVTIAAPGAFREIDASADKGTVVLTNIVGVGTESAKATITYTAPGDAGTATIKIKVIDKSTQDVTKDIAVTITDAPPIDIQSGDIEGEWGPYTTMNIKGNVTIPLGKSLIIHEGTKIVVDPGVGLTVDGNLHSMGSEKYPNTFTVSSEPQDAADVFSNLWTGIAGTTNSGEMVVLYTTLQYTSGPALEVINPDGTLVMQHSTVQYTQGNGVHVNGGRMLATNNNFLFNGETDGDALNIDNMAMGDVAFNVFISSATNGVISSNAFVNVYNNTAIECGWRQTEADRGGSFTLERKASGVVYNNMAVNCKYGVLFPNDPYSPDLDNSKAGYTLYFGSRDEAVDGFYPTNGSLTKGVATLHDIADDKDVNDPKFVTLPGGDIVLDLEYNLYIATDSPALSKGITTFPKRFEKLTIDDVDYPTPAASSTIGATTVAPKTP